MADIHDNTRSIKEMRVWTVPVRSFAPGRPDHTVQSISLRRQIHWATNSVRESSSQ